MLRLLEEKKNYQIVEVDGRELKISNISKIFWPDEGYTKGDLINYYIEIAQYILPYLKNRPESLRRYPNGINGRSFFQKNIAGLTPLWIKTVPVRSEEKNEIIHYMICNDLPSLIFLLNLGCIDVNPWNSSLPKLDKPDYLILDLDPLEISFDYVLKTALAIKKVCDELNIPAYPKTSGATGMHIYIPLEAKYAYEQCRYFAQIMATLAHKKVPDFTSLERSPSKRRGKVYIDYLQNAQGQTLAAPYSVRPKPRATISTPLRWEEVKAGVLPSDFTMKNISSRINKIGDIFRDVLGRGIDIDKILRKLENPSK